MRLRRPSPLEIAVAAIVCIVAVCTLIFSGAIANISTKEHTVISAYEARLTLASVISTLVDAETGQRGYLLTSQVDYLTPYLRSKERLTGRLAELRSQTAPLMKVEVLLSSLDQLAREKMDELDQTIDIHRLMGSSGSLDVVRANSGFVIMEQLRATAAHLETNLDMIIVTSQRDLNDEHGKLTVTAALLAIVSMILVALLSNVVRRELNAAKKREDRNAELARLAEDRAIRDALTGIHNRRHMSEILPDMLAASVQRGTPLCLAMLDIDHFKRLNDRYGHAAGDQVLEKVGSMLRATLRRGELAFRYGGEEFVIVLPDCSLTEASARMEHLQQCMRSLELSSKGGPLPIIEVSIGLAETGPSMFRLEDLLGQADAALYASKQTGRNKVSHHAA